jgi:chemotaxis protein MotB
MAKTEEKRKIIIVRRGRKGHGEHHGGSWKVAYADFVTAMMAFFLLMWLINMSSQEKRAVLAYYFKNFSLFEKGGKSFMMDGGMKPAGEYSGGPDVVETGEVSGGAPQEQEIVPKLMAWAQQNTEILNDQVFMGMTEDGIRIQIVDTVDNPVFTPGSVQLTDGAKKIIKSVSGVIKSFPNELAIEGHTDGSPTRNEQMSNWDLSVARAASARKELELDGIHPERVGRVAGYADKSPLFKENPADPRNRRISILFMKGKKLVAPERLDWLVKPPA